MPYIFCVVRADLVKETDMGFGEKEFCGNPGFVYNSGKPFEIFVRSVVSNIEDANFDTIYNSPIEGKQHLGQQFYWHKYVVLCFNSASNFSVGTRMNLSINSTADLIGCIVYSVPRIGDGQSAYVVNLDAETKDRNEFSNGVEKSQTKNKFCKELKKYAAKIEFPKEYIASPLPTSKSAESTPLIEQEDRSSRQRCCCW